MTTVPSLLLCVGRQFYKLYQYIDEAEDIGVSKRIPATSIPEGMVRGVSKIFVAHPDAILTLTNPDWNLRDLVLDLNDYQVVPASVLYEIENESVDDTEKGYSHMLDIAIAFSRLPNEERARLIETYGIEFTQGIIGYSPFYGFEYVLAPDETELPAELAHMDGYIEGVHMVYLDDDGSPEEEAE
jgi:hypothetical protein